MKNSNYNLNAFRFVYCLALAASIVWDVLPFNKRLLPAILAEPSEFSLMFPAGFFELLSREVFGLGLTGLEAWSMLLVVLLVLSAFAVFGRVPIFLSWILYSTVQFSFSQNFDLFPTNILFFSMGLLACSKAAFSGSVLRPHSVNGEDATHSRLTLALLMSLIPIVFFNAFVSKMLGGGIAWFTGRPLQAFFYIAYVAKGNSLALSLAQNMLLCQVLSCMALAFEAFLPLLLAIRRTRFMGVALALLFHSFVYLSMDISFFLPFAPLYLVYVNFSGLARLVQCCAGIVNQNFCEKN